MILFLIGFMGAGKTTTGKKLSARLGYSFIDLDAVVEKTEALTIHDIIVLKGEEYFRQQESQTLQQIEISNAVISTGGGTPCYFDNIDWMNAHGITIYIKLDEGVLFSRLKTKELHRRPLLKGLDEEGLKNFIVLKLKEREQFYNKAQLIYEPMKDTLDDLVLSINALK